MGAHDEIWRGPTQKIGSPKEKPGLPKKKGFYKPHVEWATKKKKKKKKSRDT